MFVVKKKKKLWENDQEAMKTVSCLTVTWFIWLYFHNSLQLPDWGFVAILVDYEQANKDLVHRFVLKISEWRDMDIQIMPFTFQDLIRLQAFDGHVKIILEKKREQTQIL